MEKLLIIDGNSLFNRAFYALPLLSNENGEYSNAVYGFTNILIKVITELNPKYLVVAFDYAKKTFRNAIYEDYKGNRKKTPDELVCQFPILKNLLSTMGICYIEQEGYEADDIIGTLSKTRNLQKVCLSGDRDLLQLVDTNCEVWLTKKGISEVLKIDEDNIKSLFELTPSQVIEYKGLCGDSSDNIPGVAGIGEKTAKTLLQTYGSISEIYSNLSQITGKLKEKLELGKEKALMSKKLATIFTEIELNKKLEDFTYKFPFNNNVLQFFKRYNFKSLLSRTNLFEMTEEVATSEKHQSIEVKNNAEMLKIIEKIEEEICMCVGSKISFAIDSNTTYLINNEISLLNDGEEFDKNIKALCQVVSNPKLKKVFNDKKLCMHFFDKYNTKVYGETFDINLANYLLNTTQSSQEDASDMFKTKQNLKNKLKDEDLFNFYNDVELPLVSVLFDMEKFGFKIDKFQLGELSVRYSEELNNITQKIYEQCGFDFNINSPKQLGEVLFTRLNINMPNNKKNSTAIEVLNEIVEYHPVIPLIIRYRKIQKLLSTYVDAFKKITINNDGIIHTSFNQTNTATGRLSSSEPNLQNIPVRDDEGKNLRKLFISQFKDGSIMSADYNQIELRLLANFSEDEKLIEAFKSGEDVHKKTASEIFNKPLSQITSKERRDAKAVNFGIIYGISDYGLSQNIGISRKQAKLYIDKYFEIYKDIKTYLKSLISFAKENGYAKTYFGRKRIIPEITSANFNLRSFGERVAMNLPLQGSASDIIKIAMVKVNEELAKQNLKSKLILQIHDELVVDVFNGEEKMVEQLLKNCMENVIKMQITLPVEVSCGKSWYECK